VNLVAAFLIVLLVANLAMLLWLAFGHPKHQ
jgi:hypothetical protein